MTTPDQKYKAGAVSATVWHNVRERNGQKFNSRAVVLEKRYKAQDGTWQSTNRFNASDLPKVELVVRQAFAHIATQQNGGEHDE